MCLNMGLSCNTDHQNNEVNTRPNYNYILQPNPQNLYSQTLRISTAKPSESLQPNPQRLRISYSQTLRICTAKPSEAQNLYSQTL